MIDASEMAEENNEFAPARRVGRVLFVALGCGFIGSILAFATSGLDVSSPADLKGHETVVLALPFLIALIGGAFISAGLDGRSPLRVLRLDHWKLRLAVMAFLIGVGCQAIVIMFDYLVLGSTSDSDGLSSTRLFVDSFSGTNQIFILIIFSCCLLPLADELLYRGVLLPLTIRRWSGTKSVALISLLFALSHFDLAQFPSLLFVGIVFGLLRWKKDSTTLPLIAHISFNFSGLMIVMSGVTF
jgi:membrane protease YdiL (CAAX protease family)